MKSNKKAFTLIELLVVILIISILTTMALPQYQVVVDKSRYATLMPIAKSVANAQEAFYMANGNYSIDFSFLDVQLPNNPVGNTTTLKDGTMVALSEREDYDYVKVSKYNLENNYIVYQDKSLNFPSEIHCEALQESLRAKRLCEALGGTKIDGNLTAGYDTYVLQGEGIGTPLSLAQTSSSSGNWQSCTTYPCTKTCSREVKSGYTCDGTYNEDHTYQEKVCISNWCSLIDYSDEDSATRRIVCEQKGDICEKKSEIIFDQYGNIQEVWNCLWGPDDCYSITYPSSPAYRPHDNSNTSYRTGCHWWLSNGVCKEGYDYVTEFLFDENNHVLAKREGKNCIGTTCESWGGYYSSVSGDLYY